MLGASRPCAACRGVATRSGPSSWWMRGRCTPSLVTDVSVPDRYSPEDRTKGSTHPVRSLVLAISSPNDHVRLVLYVAILDHPAFEGRLDTWLAWHFTSWSCCAILWQRGRSEIAPRTRTTPL